MASSDMRYEVLECIGRGSYGEVFKALDRNTNEHVAVKVINLEDIEDDIEDIRKEISALAGCRSRNITEYYGSVLMPGTTDLMIVMELLTCSVYDLLKFGTLEEPIIAYIMREVLQALIYLHAEKRVHRDMKAANILLSSSAEVKIADFGVSGQLTDTMGYKRKTFVGTPFWMAPEVIQSSEGGYSEKADMWSLAITAIEMACGQPPHHELHPMRVLFLIPKAPAPLLEGNFSIEFKSFVATCLQKDPAARPTATELLTHPFVANAQMPAHLSDMVQEYTQHFQPLPPRRSSTIALGGTMPAWDFGTKRMGMIGSMGGTVKSPLMDRYGATRPGPRASGLDWGSGTVAAEDVPLKVAAMRSGTLRADTSSAAAAMLLPTVASGPSGTLRSTASRKLGVAAAEPEAVPDPVGSRTPPAASTPESGRAASSPLRFSSKMRLQVDVTDSSNQGTMREISQVVRYDPQESAAVLSKILLPALRAQPLQDASNNSLMQGLQNTFMELEKAVPGASARLVMEMMVKLAAADQPDLRGLKASVQAMYGADTPKAQRSLPDLGTLGEFLLGQWKEDVYRDKAHLGRGLVA